MISINQIVVSLYLIWMGLVVFHVIEDRDGSKLIVSLILAFIGGVGAFIRYVIVKDNDNFKDRL